MGRRATDHFGNACFAQKQWPVISCEFSKKNSKGFGCVGACVSVCDEMQSSVDNYHTFKRERSFNVNKPSNNVLLQGVTNKFLSAFVCVCVDVKVMCSSVKHRRKGRLFFTLTHTLTQRRSVQRPARLPFIRFCSSWCRELEEKERTTWHD